jgi:uncharacterized membrane protein YtjA (UPF0391 family)
MAGNDHPCRRFIWRSFTTALRLLNTAWRFHMLWWALAFLLIAMLSAVLGFGMAILAIAALAKSVFYFAVVLFLVSLAGHLMRRV